MHIYICTHIHIAKKHIKNYIKNNKHTKNLKQIQMEKHIIIKQKTNIYIYINVNIYIHIHIHIHISNNL